MAIFTLCKKAGCFHYTGNKNNLCDLHQKDENKRSHNPKAKKVYNSKQWKSIRKQKLADNPLCERCSIPTDPQPAILVHHIDEDVDNCAPENLMSLCHCCHEIKHGRKKAYTRPAAPPHLVVLENTGLKELERGDGG